VSFLAYDVTIQYGRGDYSGALNGFSPIKKFNTKDVKIKLCITLIQHMLLTLTYIVNRVFFYYIY